MAGPWEKYKKPESGPWAKYQEPAQEQPAQDGGGWQPTQYGFKVKPWTLPDGTQTILREDAQVWMDGQWKIFDPKTQTFAPGTNKATTQMDWVDRNLGPEAFKSFGRNVKAGFDRPGLGLIDLKNRVLRGVGLQNEQEHRAAQAGVQDALRKGQALKNTSGVGAGMSQFIGEAAPVAAATALAPQAAAPTMLGRATLNAVPAAATAYLTTPGSAGERAQAGMLAAGGTYGVQAGLEKVVTPALRAIAGRARLNGEAAQVQELADRFGVRVSAPDLDPTRVGLNKAAVMMENVPSGRTRTLLAQNREAKAAAQRLVDQFGIEGNTGDAIQSSLSKRLAQGKQAARSAYDAVETMAQGRGNVGLTNTLETIQTLKAREGSAVVQDKDLMNLLGSIEARLADPAVDTSYTGIRALRSDLGDMVSDFYKGTNAATGSKGVGAFQSIKRAVERDLEAFTATHGNDLAIAAREADKVHKSQVVPFKDKILAKAVENSEPDTIYRTVVAQGKDRAQKFYDALTEDGRAAVRAQMVSEAFQAATKDSQRGIFSPAKFAKSLEDIADSAGVFFKGKDKWELDGFTKLMRHVQRSGQVAENPATGNRLVQLMLSPVAYAASPDLGATYAGGVVTSALINRVFNSKIGKSFLLRASDLKPGSRAMQQLIESNLPRLTAAAPSGASNVVPLKPQPAAMVAQGPAPDETEN